MEQQPPKSTFAPASGADRRKNERYTIQTPVQWRLKELKSANWADESLLDISISGAAFSATQALEAGTIVALRITPPEGATEDPNHPPVLINGTVRNSMPIEDGRFRNGVEFNRIYFLFAEWGRKLRP
jgi:hypothetical protein